MDFRDVSDLQLLPQVAAGVPDAFVELSERYQGLIHSKALHFICPFGPDIEDLHQEGFVALYAAALTYEENVGASFSTYASTCIFNRMANVARRHANFGNRALNESLPLESAGTMPTAAGPQDLLELRETLREMWKRIQEALTPLEWRALTIHLAGCGRFEIPRRTGLSRKSFDNALYRARVKVGRLTGLVDEK